MEKEAGARVPPLRKKVAATMVSSSKEKESNLIGEDEGDASTSSRHTAGPFRLSKKRIPSAISHRNKSR